MNTPRRRNERGGRCRLESPGWNEQTRRALERLIDRGAGKCLPVVFDFDNTIICGDIGEATLAVLVREGLIDSARVAKTLSPPFRLPGKGRITLEASVNPAAYYEAYLAPTAHGDRDPTPLANGYAWAVEVMEGLRPWDVVEATRKACESAAPNGPGFVEVTPGKTRFPAPTFYPEMVELVAKLLQHQFDVWIVSASSVWSVRWIIQNELNPRLRQHGVRQGLAADHVVGLSTLLTDRQGFLYKDMLLLRENSGYATLDEKVLRSFRLTSRLQFPVPTYSGKIACIHDTIGGRPHFCAGDSPGDHAMLTFSEHRLWIARLEKPGYQERTAALLRNTTASGWMVQATLTKESPGFMPDLSALKQRVTNPSPEIRKAVKVVSDIERQVSAQ